MAKDHFTDEFQKALQRETQKLFDTIGCIDGINTKCEYSKVDMLGKFNQYVDIGIKDDDNEFGFVGVEIEHFSNYEQAKENIRKLKAWAHNSTKRQCGLLHLFNEECYIYENEICLLRDFARDNEIKGYGFYYDYAFYTPGKMSPETVAKKVVASKDFRTRLYQLLKYTGSCQ